MKSKFMTAAFAVLTASALMACNSDKAQAQKPTASTEIKKEETPVKIDEEMDVKAKEKPVKIITKNSKLI